jgi:Flp pilus assembly protein TadG
MTEHKVRLPNLSANAIWYDTDGYILPYVALLLVVFVGFSVLALDGARYVSLQTQLQNGADEIALAGAAELDGSPSAIIRADNAVTNATNNLNFHASSLFGTGADQFVSVNHRYLSALPASDQSSPIPSSLVTTDPLQAQFIEVTAVSATDGTSPVTMQTILPAIFFGGANLVPAPATAVAGFTQNVCKFTPMYVCNPWEQDGDTYEQATQRIFDHDTADPNDINHRAMFSLRNDPGGSMNPGNYGFLDSPLGNGVNAIRQSIARVNPQACFAKRGVDTQTGFTGASLAGAFNVRFDLWDGSMNAHTNDAEYAPALDVRKGYLPAARGGSCADPLPVPLPTSKPQSPPPAAMELPPDWCGGAYCTNMVGNTGVWDFDTYWNAEHPTASGNKPVVNGAPASNTNLPSRYTVYQYEISRGTSPGGLTDPSNSATPELGTPSCNRNTPPPTVDRRILFTAIFNCKRLTADGVLSGGKNTNVPVASFAKFFILHPMGSGATGQIDAEFVGTVKQSDHVSFNNYQLYR